jgi:hypothetical protein
VAELRDVHAWDARKGALCGKKLTRDEGRFDVEIARRCAGLEEGQRWCSPCMKVLGIDPGHERWRDLEGALIEAIGWLTEIARGAEVGRHPDPRAVRQRRDALLTLADEIQDARHERGMCPAECAACEVEAEEKAREAPR